MQLAPQKSGTRSQPNVPGSGLSQMPQRSIFEGVPPGNEDPDVKRERQRAMKLAAKPPPPATKPLVEVRRDAALLMQKRRAGQLHDRRDANRDAAVTTGLHQLSSWHGDWQRPAAKVKVDVDWTLVIARVPRTSSAHNRASSHSDNALPTKEELLRKSFGVMRPDAPPDHSYPLHTAAARGNLAACRALIDGRADVAAQNAYGSTALHYAAVNGRAAVAVQLLKAGAPLGVSNITGKARAARPAPPAPRRRHPPLRAERCPPPDAPPPSPARVARRRRSSTPRSACPSRRWPRRPR